MSNWYDPYLLLGDPVIVTDADHRVLAVNAAYEQASGYRLDEILGKDSGYIKSGLTPPAVYASMKQALQEGVVWKGMLANRRPDGRLWNSSLTITPVRRPEGVYYIGVCRDVQEITNHNIADSYQQLFFLIARITEAGDPSVEPHLHRVSRLSQCIARWAGWSQPWIDWLGLASILHDVGKIFIPREILFKPGPLSPQERQLIETHAPKGADLLTRLNDHIARIYGYHEALAMALEIAAYHHESFDGNGYPQGLKGCDIPRSARVVALADVVDALWSPRPYKTAWPSHQIRDYLRQKRGRQFDPELVDALLAHWSEVEDLYRNTAERNAGGL